MCWRNFALCLPGSIHHHCCSLYHYHFVHPTSPQPFTVHSKRWHIMTRIKNIKNVTRCRDSRSAKSIETRSGCDDSIKQFSIQPHPTYLPTFTIKFKLREFFQFSSIVNWPNWPSLKWHLNSFFPLLVPCVYIFIFPNTYSTCTYLQINFIYIMFNSQYANFDRMRYF